MSIKIVPFADDHVESACQLLAARHRCMKQHEAFLPGDFLDPQRWADILVGTRAKAQTPGLVAIAEGDFAGYLLWTYDDTQPEGLYSPFSPPGGVEVSLNGFAVDPARPFVARRLYAAASKAWIADGRGIHILPAATAEPQVLDELYGLGFGRLFSLAAREWEPSAVQAGAGLTVFQFRKAMPGDEDTVRRLAGDLWSSFTESPVHFPRVPEAMPDLYAHTDRYIADPASPVWLAERQGHAEALEVFLTPESSDWFLAPPMTPPEAIYLLWASTSPEARGTGVHSALLAHTSRWAYEQGRSTMLLHYLDASFASEYWKRQGFRPVSHWLRRSIDPRALRSS